MFRHADVVYFLSCVASCVSSQCYMSCSMLMLVEDARGEHMEDAFSRAGLMTAL